MGLRKYFIFSSVFILAIGAYIYSLNGNVYTITFFGIPVTLKVALWFVLPLVLLVLASVIHMMFYSFKNYLEQRNLKKDYSSFISQIKMKLLMQDSEPNFVTNFFKTPSKLLKVFKIDFLSDMPEIEDKELKNIVENIKKIENGEVVDIKKYKLPKDNYFVQQNSINEMKKDFRKVEQAIKNCDDKKSEFCLKVFDIYSDHAPYKEIKESGFEIDKKLFEKLLGRFKNSEDSFKLGVDELIELFDKFDFDKREYIYFAKELKSLMNPEAVINLFERVSNEKEKALSAYLYLLFEFQMIDKAREILQNLSQNECENFKYFLYLKDSGKNFDIDIFFDI